MTTTEISYEIRVTDERYRRITGDLIHWELAGGRKVRVTALIHRDLSGDGAPGTSPEAAVKLFEDEDHCKSYAVVVLPPNDTRRGGMRTWVMPIWFDVLNTARKIAEDANARLAEDAADEPETPEWDPGDAVDDEGGMSEHRSYASVQDTWGER